MALEPAVPHVTMRRLHQSMGHILERAPGNIMSGLRPPTATTYMTETDTQVLLGEQANTPINNDAQQQQQYGGIFGGSGTSGYTGSGERDDAPPEPIFQSDEAYE